MGDTKVGGLQIPGQPRQLIKTLSQRKVGHRAQSKIPGFKPKESTYIHTQRRRRFSVLTLKSPIPERKNIENFKLVFTFLYNMYPTH